MLLCKKSAVRSSQLQVCVLSCTGITFTRTPRSLTMTPERIYEVTEAQRAFFQSGATLDVDGRIASLRTLRGAVHDYTRRFIVAAAQDAGLSEHMVLAAEIAPVINDIDHMIKRLPALAKGRLVRRSRLHMWGWSRSVPRPAGIAVAVTAADMPVQRALMPVVSALAAGTPLLLALSPRTPAVNGIVERLVQQFFKPEQITVTTADNETTEAILGQRFDACLCSAPRETAVRFARAAAEHLVPAVIETAEHRNPAIVLEDADIRLAARRIVWAKTLAAGQTAAAPDYLVVHGTVRERLLAALRKELEAQHGAIPSASSAFGRMTDNAAYEEAAAFLTDGTPVIGGDTDPAGRFINFTVLENVQPDAPVMRSVTRSPVLPLFEVQSAEQAVELVNSRPAPLALYVFSTDVFTARKVLDATTSGTAAVNDVLVQTVYPALPFGDAAGGGMGSHRGEAGFFAFSRLRSVTRGTNFIDLPFRFSPDAGWKQKILRYIIR